MNNQTTGIIERVLYGIALAFTMKLVSWGLLDADMAPYLAGGAVGAIGSLWAWWINRPKAIAQAAASIPGTTVITTAEIANSTPNETNIVSSSETNAFINKEIQVNKNAEIQSTKDAAS